VVLLTCPLQGALDDLEGELPSEIHAILESVEERPIGTEIDEEPTISPKEEAPRSVSVFYIFLRFSRLQLGSLSVWCTGSIDNHLPYHYHPSSL